MKDLLRTADLSRHDFRYLLDLAAELKTGPDRYRFSLQGQVVVTYYAKPSTRTRLSFEAAIARLGGVPAVVGPQELQLGRGETIEDTARVISRYARAFVIRTYAHDDVRRFAEAAAIPVVNALTDDHHPCQSLADLLTLRERLGLLRGRKLAYVGDGNNVAHSLMEGAALAGMDIVVASPEGYEADLGVVARARALAADAGSGLVMTRDPIEAVRGADAVYTDVWVSMGDSEAVRAAKVAALRSYQVNGELMAHAKPEALFLHCLPAHRGEEVTGEVIDGPHSVVFDQAENRLHTAQALLIALINGNLVGAPPAAGLEVAASGRTG